eukprot:3292263-Amphidinium_carterae.2
MLEGRMFDIQTGRHVCREWQHGRGLAKTKGKGTSKLRLPKRLAPSAPSYEESTTPLFSFNS